jgi:hypothetical protein
MDRPEVRQWNSVPISACEGIISRMLPRAGAGDEWGAQSMNLVDSWVGDQDIAIGLRPRVVQYHHPEAQH